MTNQEILTKAIEKAVAGGWSEHLEASAEDWIEGFREDDMSDEMVTAMAGTLIFNHDFAKALWSEEIGRVDSYTSGALYNVPNGYYGFNGPRYMFHLQEMVIADDPIAYLGENI